MEAPRVRYTSTETRATLTVADLLYPPYEYSKDSMTWLPMPGGTVTITGLLAGTDYTYYVRGAGTETTTAHISTHAAAPSVKSIVQETSVNVRVPTTPGVMYIFYNWENDRYPIMNGSITISGLKANTTYKYHIHSIRNGFRGMHTRIQDFRFLTLPAPPVASAAASSPYTGTLNVRATTGLTYSYSITGKDKWIALKGSANLSNLAQNRSYTYYVRATNASGSSRNTKVTFKTPPAPLTIRYICPIKTL